MKIIYISESTIPSRTANSIHVIKMCQAFAKNGHEVTLIAPKRKDTEILINDITIYKYYGVERTFSILWMNYPMIRRFGVLYYGFTSALKAKKLNADLVYGRSLNGCFFSALLKMSTYYEEHQPPSRLFIKLLTKMIFKSKSLRKLIVITKPLKEIFINNYPEVVDKVVVAPDGADPVTESTLIDSIIEKKPERFQVGYAGHLYEGRGIELIAEMANSLINMDFHLVGGFEEDILKWKKKFGFLNNLIFHGFIPHGMLAGYLNSFDALLAPYQTEVYTKAQTNTAAWMSPLKLFEYMAVGKPILCSDLPVLREVLEHGSTAILLESDDVVQWIEALKYINENNDYATRIGKKAKVVFANNYTWEARVNSIIG